MYSWPHITLCYMGMSVSACVVVIAVAVVVVATPLLCSATAAG